MSRVPLLVLTCVTCGAPVEVDGLGTRPERAVARVLDPGCVNSPYTTIQQAIDAALDNDVVEVCAGTYLEHLTIVGKRLTLRSLDGADVTVVDATLGGRALSVTGNSLVTVEGFTFRNGLDASGKGGNVECDASNLLLRDNVVESGEAERGGGVSLSSCTGRIDGNIFRSNYATDRGGGLYADGTVDVLGNTFEGNGSDNVGGAAFLKDTYAMIRDNSVVANTAHDDGGGIFVYRGAPWVDSNLFEDNESGEEGGGLRIKSSEAVITDNTLTGNHADWRGGGMKHSHDESFFSGNTWIDNDAYGDGGALLMYESASTLLFEHFEDNEADDGGAIAIIAGWGPVTIEDCTFADNEGDRGGHLYIELPVHTVSMRRVDLFDGQADEGGAVYATGSDLDLGNVTFAGNIADEGGGAVSLDATTGEIHNAVVMWNEAPDGSAIRVTDGAVFDVSNTAFESNSGGAAISYVRDLLVPGGVAPTLRYNDFYLNTLNFWGMWSAVGLNGNVSVPTGFVDPAAADWALGPNSPLENSGDPSIPDTDGSRSDIGRYGGPDAY